MCACGGGKVFSKVVRSGATGVKKRVSVMGGGPGWSSSRCMCMARGVLCEETVGRSVVGEVRSIDSNFTAMRDFSLYVFLECCVGESVLL